MKKNLITFALLGAITLSMFSCGDKKKDEPKVEKEKPQEKKEYLLSKVISKSGSYSSYEYDDKGRLSMITYVSPTPGGTNYSFGIYIYNQEGLLSSVVYKVEKSNTIGQEKKIDYQGGRISSIKDDNAPSYLYACNEKGQITKETFSGTEEYSLFLYDKKGNVIKEDLYLFNKETNKHELYKVTYYKYDTKINPLCFGFFTGGNLAKQISPNNLVKDSAITYSNKKEPYKQVNSYSYQYNEAGYPVKVKKIFSEGYTNTETYEYIEKK